MSEPSTKEFIKMVLPVNYVDDEPGVETVWVRPLPNGNFQVENIPLRAYDISLDDEVSGFLESADDNRLHFSSVIRRSGNVTYRIYLTQEAVDDPRAIGLKKKIEGMCNPKEVFSRRNIAYNVGPRVNRETLLGILNDGEELGFWEYETGADDPMLPA